MDYRLRNTDASKKEKEKTMKENLLEMGSLRRLVDNGVSLQRLREPSTAYLVLATIKSSK